MFVPIDYWSKPWSEKLLLAMGCSQGRLGVGQSAKNKSAHP